MIGTTTELLSIKDIAHRLKESPRSTARRLAADMLPEPIKIPSATGETPKLRWPVETIERWMALSCPSRVDFEELCGEQ